jgi:hypothetical protein
MHGPGARPPLRQVHAGVHAPFPSPSARSGARQVHGITKPQATKCTHRCTRVHERQSRPSARTRGSLNNPRAARAGVAARVLDNGWTS